MATMTAHRFPATVGTLLKAGRYEIFGMLGQGSVSATYLVRDNEPERDTRYYAAKVLDHDETERHLAGHRLECEFMEALLNDPEKDADWFMMRLHDSFLQKTETGLHLCFVMLVLGNDVDSFQRLSPTKALYPYVVQNSIMSVAEALAGLHRLGIIHTDVKASNILFDYGPDDTEIERHFGIDATPNKNSSLLLEPSPLGPLEWLDMDPSWAECMSYRLIDLGSAQWSQKPRTAAHFSEYALRAPELVLDAEFDEKIDIWALGCVTFELLTGRCAFHPEENGDMSRDENHLNLMMRLTGQTFDDDLLKTLAGKRTSEFFNEKGQLRHSQHLPPALDIEARLESCGYIHEVDIEPAAQFIRACLEFDPAKRISAYDACVHPWISHAAGCCSVKSNWTYTPNARHEH